MSKLHPVYVALDNHQYSRAIKLALALPDSNVLGKALLAHAYYKSGQQYQSMFTLYTILSTQAGSRDFFCEIKVELERALEGIEEREQQASKPAAPDPVPVAASKKGKKGKKKPSTKPSTTNASGTTPTKECDIECLDLMDALLTKPTLPDNWDVLPASSNAITDETTIATMSVTLNGLKLPLTAFQLYSWAITNQEGATEANIQKNVCLGLTVLTAPSIWTSKCQEKIATLVRAHMQSIALQWARLYARQPGGLSSYRSMLATAWAAQSALWQLQLLPKDDKRSMILPRLAESMAQKLLDQNDGTTQSAEIQCLALRAFEQQSKWEEMLRIVGEPLDESDEQSSPLLASEFGVALTRQQRLKERARILKELGHYDDAKNVYERLLTGSPDDWYCWKGHLECCSKLDDLHLAREFVDRVLSEQATEKYPLRGPHLMKIELDACKLRSKQDRESLTALAASIKEYSELFAGRAACAFSDLESYIELALSAEVDESEQVVEDLLKYARQMQITNVAPQHGSNLVNKELQSRLRVYIFAVKFTHKILAKHVGLQDSWLPKVADLVSEWKATMAMSSSNEGEESQREMKPGDDLIILAVQQLMYKSHEDKGCQIISLVLLEAAIEHSPDNAFLKILAIYVNYLLDAVPRAYEHFVTMGIKHIQLDSCTFIILPYLLEGGLYNEAIEICNALLKFQTSTARDCGDYAGRAMEDGTITKANEFVVFQRSKMNTSLAVLNAKGVILDSAGVRAAPVQGRKLEEPLVLKGALGLDQGIVGSDDDMARAAHMIVQAHKPYAALSLVSWSDHGGLVSDCEDMADNRDFSILSNQILMPLPLLSTNVIGSEALRRGHIHGMLLRATLCLDVAKGPKKGKVVKPTEQVTKRTRSLLECLDRISSFAEAHSISETNQLSCKALLVSAVELCRVLAVISSGISLNPDDDSLENREQCAVDILKTRCLSRLTEANESLELSVKNTGSLLPNFIVPLFAVFRMCANLCDLFGWGRRKYKSKQCAEALKEFAAEFSRLVSKLLSSVSGLPGTAEAVFPDGSIKIDDSYQNLVDASMLKKTLDIVANAQFRTRLRIEPILVEMSEFLESFDLQDD